MTIQDKIFSQLHIDPPYCQLLIFVILYFYFSINCSGLKFNFIVLNMFVYSYVALFYSVHVLVLLFSLASFKMRCTLH